MCIGCQRGPCESFKLGRFGTSRVPEMSTTTSPPDRYFFFFLFFVGLTHFRQAWHSET